MKLMKEWKKRQATITELTKLADSIDDLRKDKKIFIEDNKKWATLMIKRAEAHIELLDSIAQIYGNIAIEWIPGGDELQKNLLLENGDLYKWDD